MKITSSSSPSINSVTSSRTPAGTRTGKNAPERSTVELSLAARQLATLKNSDNDVDVARVQAIRDAIASGQLKIDTGRIADSLLASARELLK